MRTVTIEHSRQCAGKSLDGALVKSLALVLLLVGALEVSVGAMTRRPAAALDGFTGPVKMVREEVARFTDRNGKRVEGKKILVRVLVYDEKGNLAEESRYAAGSLCKKVTYTYDEDGKKTSTDFMPRGSCSQEEGEPTGTAGFADTVSTPYNLVYDDSFDNAGNLETEDVRYEIGVYQGVYLRREEYFFDKKGRRWEWRHYGPDGALTFKQIFEYGADGQVSRMRPFDAKNAPLPAETYTYRLDSRGNWVQRTTARAVPGGDAPQPFEVIYRKITYY